MEKRERDRVNIKLECRIDLSSRPHVSHLRTTENISRTGMLIRWERDRSEAPVVGDSVLVSLKLPANPTASQRWMVFRAKVVRVSMAEDESLMLAVAGSRVHFSARPVSPIDLPVCTPHLN